MAVMAELYASQPHWVWVGLAAALLAVEVASGSGWLLWASASAAAVALLAFFGLESFAAALLIYALLTIASTLLARRYLPRSVVGTAGDINDNVARLVGRRATAVAAFHGRSGRVSIDGKEWAAELGSGDRLEAGASVEVIAVEGARLTVRPVP